MKDRKEASILDKENASEWLRRHAIVLDTASPREDQSELSPIKEIVGSASVVGLGEATHGTKEFFQIKHRLIRYLIENMGFNTVVFECPETKARGIDNFIKGDSSQRDILEGLTYEVWHTQEILDLINWLKTHNENSENKVSFYGCDVDDQTGMSSSQRDAKMAANVQTIASNPGSKIALWAHNAHVGNANGSDFKPLGAILKEDLAEQYISFGMLFHEGSFLAREGSMKDNKFSNQRSVVSVGPVHGDSYEQIFASTNIHLGIFDIRPAKNDNQLGALRNNQLKLREMGWLWDKSDEEQFRSRADLSNTFDVIFWIAQATAATPLN